jgi:putative two-component system response regulator
METGITKPKILIIDDEPISQTTLQAYLSGKNYDLVFANNGQEGIVLAEIHQPDIILLDVMMPGMDGFETCREIRSRAEIAETSILMITALDDRQSKMNGLDAGADDFITKPFDIYELLIRIQNLSRINRYRKISDQRMQLANLNEELLIAYNKTIEGWSKAVDLRDKETEGHTQRVATLTLNLAHAAGQSSADLKQIWRGALLHDVGKLGIPDRILLKEGPLDATEWEIMRRHPVYAFEWLSPIDYLHPAIDIPYCHHEKWDGSGYPRGLRGTEIPLAARLFAVVDVWDALTSDRPYRKALPDSEARSYIMSQRGKHFDPYAVDLFLTQVPPALD